MTREISGGAIEVHRWLGPGLLDAVYEEALCHELHLRSFCFKRQQRVPLHYRGVLFATDLRLDLLVNDTVIVEGKAKEALSAIDEPQLLTYLRLCDVRAGLIINFQMATLKDGLFGVVNGLRDDPSSAAEFPDFRSPLIT